MSEHFIGAIVDDAMYRECNRAGLMGVKNNRAVGDRPIQDVLPGANEMVGHSMPPIYTVAGDHSRVAMGELTKQFPKNEKYQYAFVDVVVCEENHETNRFLGLIGAVDNMKPNRKPDFREWILGMHRRAMEALIADEWDKEYVRFLKQDMRTSLRSLPQSEDHGTSGTRPLRARPTSQSLGSCQNHSHVLYLSRCSPTKSPGGRCRTKFSR